jgi:hypothetical protein
VAKVIEDKPDRVVYVQVRGRTRDKASGKLVDLNKSRSFTAKNVDVDRAYAIVRKAFASVEQ